MGAYRFTDTCKKTGTLPEDFREVAEQARWEHGHGGYSGTIAEKWEVVDVTKLVPEQYRRTGRDAWFPATKCPQDWPQDDWKEVSELYEDKWGPACAMLTADGATWVFFGTASS